MSINWGIGFLKCEKSVEWNIIPSQKWIKYWCTDEPWKHYATWKKSDIKGYVLYDSTHIKCSEQANPWWQKVDTWFIGIGRRWEGSDYQWVCSFFWGLWTCSGVRVWWWLHNFMNILRTTEFCPLKGWILLYVNWKRKKFKKDLLHVSHTIGTPRIPPWGLSHHVPAGFPLLLIQSALDTQMTLMRAVAICLWNTQCGDPLVDPQWSV